MSLFLRITVTITAMIALVAGVAFARPAWMKDMGIDFWSLPELETLIQQQNRLSTNLDEKRLQLQEIYDQKDLVVEKLIERKMTLAEATRRIREVSGPEFLEESCEILELAHSTEEEGFQNLVLYWVEQRLLDNPGAYRQVRIRLEMEIQHGNQKGKSVKI